MIKTETNRIIYHDDNNRFTVEVIVDETNQTKSIYRMIGPGLSGAVISTNEAADFLELMHLIYQDLAV